MQPKIIEDKEINKEQDTKSLSTNVIIDTSNPVEGLHFDNYEKNTTYKRSGVFTFLIVSIILLSMTTSLCFNSLQNCFIIFKSTLVDLITCPYVVTIGEYKDFKIAKENAIKLLPKLRQINIKQFKNGIYTFEMDRLNSKKEAYLLAKKFLDAGFDSVHVRYLPNQ